MSGCQMRDVGLPLDVPLLRLAYVYDAQGRRAAKRVFAREINAAGTGREATERLRSDWRYWYDGWNLMVEKDLVRWTPKFGPVAERSEFRVGAGLEQQPRHPNTQ
jgi:hypothetical protein